MAFFKYKGRWYSVSVGWLLIVIFGALLIADLLTAVSYIVHCFR